MVKTFTITYHFNREHEGEPAGTVFVGSGYGESEKQALADFRFWHYFADLKIIGIEEYR